MTWAKASVMASSNSRDGRRELEKIPFLSGNCCKISQQRSVDTWREIIMTIFANNLKVSQTKLIMFPVKLLTPIFPQFG